MTKIPTLLETFKEGRKRVKAGWTQGIWARDITGATVATDDSSAVEWCAIGAVKGPNQNAALHWLRHVIQLEMDPMEVEVLILAQFIIDWNDEKDRTQEEVVAAFDEVIRRIEAGESI